MLEPRNFTDLHGFFTDINRELTLINADMFRRLSLVGRRSLVEAGLAGFYFVDGGRILGPFNLLFITYYLLFCGIRGWLMFFIESWRILGFNFVFRIDCGFPTPASAREGGFG